MKKEQSRIAKRMNLYRAFYAELNKQPYPQMRKEAILSEYGATSTKQLSITELEEAVKMMRKSSSLTAEVEKMRKRVIAAACAMLTEMESESFRQADSEGKIAMAKAVAARAAKAEDFNRISADKLRALYGAFRTKVSVMRAVVPAALEIINDKRDGDGE